MIFIDEYCIDILHIREAYQLVDGSIVADIALEFWIGLAPLFGSHAKHRHIQYVGLLGILHCCLLTSYFCRNEVALDGISM